MEIAEAVKLLTVAFLAAMTAVGIISWVKAGWDIFAVKEKRTLKAVFAWVLVPVAAFVAAVTFDGGIWRMLAVGGLTLSFIQVCYETVYKFILTVVDWLKECLISRRAGNAREPASDSEAPGGQG